MAQAPTPPPDRRQLGPPLDWSDEDIDALSTPSSADEKAADALWQRDAPSWAKGLMDAQTEEST